MTQTIKIKLSRYFEITATGRTAVFVAGFVAVEFLIRIPLL